jgi:hypothetical protein
MACVYTIPHRAILLRPEGDDRVRHYCVEDSGGENGRQQQDEVPTGEGGMRWEGGWERVGGS